MSATVGEKSKRIADQTNPTFGRVTDVSMDKRPTRYIATNEDDMKIVQQLESTIQECTNVKW